MGRPVIIPQDSELYDDLHIRAMHLRTEKSMSVQQIATELNISAYNARKLLAEKGKPLPRTHKYRAVYPRLERWIITTYGSVAACARALGMRNTALEQIVYWGGEYTRKCIIDRILAASGLTYEAAFSEAKTQR